MHAGVVFISEKRKVVQRGVLISGVSIVTPNLIGTYIEQAQFATLPGIHTSYGC